MSPKCGRMILTDCPKLKYVKFADYTVMNDNFADASKSLKAIILNSKITPYNFC